MPAPEDIQHSPSPGGDTRHAHAGCSHAALHRPGQKAVEESHDRATPAHSGSLHDPAAADLLGSSSSPRLQFRGTTGHPDHTPAGAAVHDQDAGAKHQEYSDHSSDCSSEPSCPRDPTPEYSLPRSNTQDVTADEELECTGEACSQHNTPQLDMNDLLNSDSMKRRLPKSTDVKGRAAYMHKHRHDSVAPGNSKTPLEEAYIHACRKECGDTQESVEAAAHQCRQLLESQSQFSEDEVLYPGSYHYIRAVLGAVDPIKYRFGFCSRCSLRFEETAEEKAGRGLAKTCERCGEALYRVWPHQPDH